MCISDNPVPPKSCGDFDRGGGALVERHRDTARWKTLPERHSAPVSSAVAGARALTDNDQPRVVISTAGCQNDWRSASASRRQGIESVTSAQPDAAQYRQSPRQSSFWLRQRAAAATRHGPASALAMFHSPRAILSGWLHQRPPASCVFEIAAPGHPGRTPFCPSHSILCTLVATACDSSAKVLVVPGISIYPETQCEPRKSDGRTWPLA